MKMTTRIITVAALIAASGLALHVALSQLPGIKRTDLQRHDLSVPGREVVQVRVDFAPGVAFPPHSHPGEEPGFKWSSQHLDGGGCDEDWETALGSGATSRVAGFAWPARRGAAGEPAAVLGGDRGGSVERGRGHRGRRVARGGGPLVPGGGRDVTQVAGAIREATLRALSGGR